MIYTLNQSIFQQAIDVLRLNTPDTISNALTSLQNHQSFITTDYQNELRELKFILVNYKKNEAQSNTKKSMIDTTDIQPWIPQLLNLQQVTIFNDVKVSTLQKITGGKAQMDHIDHYLQEIYLKVINQAKKTKLAYNAIDTVNLQVYVLQEALSIQSFLSTNGISANEIADYEVAKYYALYRSSGGS